MAVDTATDTDADTNMDTFPYTYTYTYTQTHTHTHIYIYIHTYTCTCTCWSCSALSLGESSLRYGEAMRSIETDYSPPTFSGIGERDVYTYFDMGYLLICINFTI